MKGKSKDRMVATERHGLREGFLISKFTLDSLNGNLEKIYNLFPQNISVNLHWV